MIKTNPIDKALLLMSPDVELFNAEIAKALEPQRPYLTEIEYSLYTKGKRLRPLLLMMTARMSSGCAFDEPLPNRVFKAAASLEMLHMATLIHDDIIDKAPKRRGVASVNESRGPDVALLIGDMQFVSAVRCFSSAIETKEDLDLVQTVLEVGFKICCGELDEIMTDARWDTERLRTRYLRTIDRKTASLIQLSCESGASLMRSRKRVIWKLGRYGRLLGRAFQMMDDLTDFTESEEQSGKQRGTDLRMRRPTLPIIYAMEELGNDSLVSRIIRGKDVDEEQMNVAIDQVMYSEGFQRAYKEARHSIIQAVTCLEPFSGDLKELFESIAYYVVDRGVV
ncbi:MAG: polyprenyl synthetase family protein [Bacteroidota bacterium]